MPINKESMCSVLGSRDSGNNFCHLSDTILGILKWFPLSLLGSPAGLKVRKRMVKKTKNQVTDVSGNSVFSNWILSVCRKQYYLFVTQTSVNYSASLLIRCVNGLWNKIELAFDL